MEAVVKEVGILPAQTHPLEQRLTYIPASRQVGMQAAAKRLLDIIVSLILLIGLLPFIIILGLLILVETGRPILFRQQRLGLNGEHFTVFKFRSMHRNAEQRLAEVLANNEIKDGPIFKWRLDPRITRVGRFLRRTSLDELPQLLNVLRGDMSLVGPRPPLESEVVRYEPWHMGRLSAKPGMTGLWQVSGRSNLNFNQMVELDNAYAEQWSFWLDLKLLLKTPLAVFTGRGAF
jgi:exopolysaccharide biosynthesis polyprenyl glycosylphosphotransferase